MKKVVNEEISSLLLRRNVEGIHGQGDVHLEGQGQDELFSMHVFTNKCTSRTIH